MDRHCSWEDKVDELWCALVRDRSEHLSDPCPVRRRANLSRRPASLRTPIYKILLPKRFLQRRTDPALSIAVVARFSGKREIPNLITTSFVRIILQLVHIELSTEAPMSQTLPQWLLTAPILLRVHRRCLESTIPSWTSAGATGAFVYLRLVAFTFRAQIERLQPILSSSRICKQGLIDIPTYFPTIAIESDHPARLKGISTLAGSKRAANGVFLGPHD